MTNLIDGSFEQEDPIGEYFLYREGALQVSVGYGHVDGVCRVSTSDVRPRARALSGAHVAHILGQFLAMMGDQKGGYQKLSLHLDGKYLLSPEDLYSVDKRLLALGFHRTLDSESNFIRWEK